MTDKAIRLFTAEHCTPCQLIKELTEEGRFTINGKPEGEVEIVDLGTDEGFENIVLHNIEAIPSAIDKNGKSCEIDIDENNRMIIFNCANDYLDSEAER